MGILYKSYEQNLQARQSYEEIAHIAASYRDKDKNLFKMRKRRSRIVAETNKNVRKKKKQKSSDNLKNSDRADKIRESWDFLEEVRKINSEVAAWIYRSG